jgi:AcrR family transcriptional regulator
MNTVNIGAPVVRSFALARRPSRELAPRVRAKAPGRYHHGDLRRVLLDAALVLVSQGGPESATLRAVASRAGVSAAAPYNHFADKAALLAAVAEEGLLVLARFMREARNAATTPAARFEAIGLAYVRFAATHPTHFRLFSTPELADKDPHPSLRHAYEEAFGVLFDCVRECRDAGVLAPGDDREMALAAWAMVHGLSWLVVDGQSETAGFTAKPEALAATALRHLSRGLRAR